MNPVFFYACILTFFIVAYVFASDHDDDDFDL